MNDKKLISLQEASEILGYTPAYIGLLYAAEIISGIESTPYELNVYEEEIIQLKQNNFQFIPIPKLIQMGIKNGNLLKY